jgi:hypothetical protein
VIATTTSFSPCTTSTGAMTLPARKFERNWSFHQQAHRHEPVVLRADIDGRSKGSFQHDTADGFSAASVIAARIRAIGPEDWPFGRIVRDRKCIGT